MLNKKDLKKGMIIKYDSGGLKFEAIIKGTTSDDWTPASCAITKSGTSNWKLGYKLGIGQGDLRHCVILSTEPENYSFKAKNGANVECKIKKCT